MSSSTLTTKGNKPLRMDISSIIEAIRCGKKKEIYSTIPTIINTLSEKCSSKDDTESLVALETVKNIVENVPEVGAFSKDLLVPCLKQAVSRNVNVRNLATEATKAICISINPFAIKNLLPIIYDYITVERKWQIRVLALSCISYFHESAPKQLGSVLPDVVPKITACMLDTKKQVTYAATNAMEAVCNVIENDDIKHMTGRIIAAIRNPKDVPEIMHQMAGVTFVQSVQSPALAMVVPLLLRGLREKSTATKRQSAVIINNMSKLVDNPMSAAPFLPLLLPALKLNSESIPEPEARDVTQKALDQLSRLKGLINNNTIYTEEKLISVIKSISNSMGIAPNVDDPNNFDKVIKYTAIMAHCMMDTRFMEDIQWVKNITPNLNLYFDHATAKDFTEKIRIKAEGMLEVSDDDEDDDDAEEICNCKFTLAYGTKILLHNTQMKLKRGRRYGLLGVNDSGKTTLMRSIANNQVEGFPDTNEIRTVFVESDIQGEQSHLSCVDYVACDPKIKSFNISKSEIREVLSTVGFDNDGKAKPDCSVSTLSGGWRMKLALARAMLQKADILLLDEPTNHLDVINVAWVKNYINSLNDVTSIIVSHDSGLINDCCTNILQIENLKLNSFKGNLDDFVKVKPSARAYFTFTASKLMFKFPQPGPIDGVKSKGKALMKMSKCTFTYPGNNKPTLYDISVQVSLSSRVACVGENGAGKSTMIKLLVGEIEPQDGTVWKHPNARIAYVAQHAFHHIENHLNKTPNEYIRWRYANQGEDKESLVKVTMQFTDEELKLQKTPFEIQWIDEQSGKISKAKKVVVELVGGRKQNKSKEYEYEVRYAGSVIDSGEYLSAKTLKKMGWDRAMKAVDLKMAQRSGLFIRTLSTKNVEEHLEHCGLSREFGTHYRMSALSGGQKVKVVVAAAMWNQPHILILDEPTNYLDRESLGAFAGAIEEYEGGVVMITHNNEFCSQLCPETWIMDAGHLETKGDTDWMLKQDTKIQEQKQITHITDAAGNEVKVKGQKKKLSKKEAKQQMKKIKQKLKDGYDLDSDEEDFAVENDLI